MVDIRVDAVGRKILNLNSRTSHAKHRLVCDIQLKGNMKIVTLRSGTRLFNCTKTPLEFILLDYSTGHQLPGTQVQTVNPDGIIHLPIINAFESRFAVRPASKVHNYLALCYQATPTIFTHQVISDMIGLRKACFGKTCRR